MTSCMAADGNPYTCTYARGWRLGEYLVKMPRHSIGFGRMTGLRTILAMLAALAGLLLGASPAAAERLVSPALPGFVVGHEAANEQQSLREEVPSGETVQDWTRMVTTQRFGGAASRLTPTGFLEVITRNLMAACPGAQASRVLTGTRGGHPSAQIRAFCPLLAQSGKPEAFIMLAITGDSDLHVKQVAFRRVPTDDDIQWGEEVLAAVAFCETGQADDACRR